MMLTAPNLLLLSSLRFFKQHPLQLGLTLLSIALGTAVIIAVSLANQSARESFSRSIAALSGPMTHEITAQQGHIPDTFYRTLRLDWQYRDSLPFFEKAIVIQGSQYRLLGIDPFAYTQSASGALPDLSLLVLSQLLNQPGSVILSSTLAQQWNIKAGDTLPLSSHNNTSTEQALTVLMIIDDERLLADALITDISSAHRLADHNGSKASNSGLTHIHLKLTPEQEKTLETQLPDSLQLRSFEQQQAVFSQMTTAFRTNLLAMSLLALLIGAFLVYNTMTFSVLQRRRSFAIMRMLGFTGEQLFRLLLLEAVCLGLIGSLLGVMLGYLMAGGLLALVTRVIDDLYLSVSASQLSIAPASLFLGVGITFLAVIIATLGPAREAAQVEPVQMSRWSHLESATQHNSRYYWIASLICLGLSALLFGLPGSTLWQGFAGLFILVLSYSLAIPQMLSTLLRWCKRLPFKGLGFIMVIRGVESGLSRITVSLIALSIAVSATVGVSIMINAFRTSVADWLNSTLSSDLYISAVSSDGNRVQGTLDQRWLTYVNTLPDIASQSTGLSTRLMINERPVPTLVMQPGAHSRNGFNFLEVIDKNSEVAWQDFLKGDGVFVSEPFAYHQQKAVGDTLILTPPDNRPVALKISGIFQDYSSTQGVLVLPRILYERYWPDRGISSIGLNIAEQQNNQQGTQHDTIKRLLLNKARDWQAPGQAVVIRSDQAIREQSLAIFDRTFIITHVLRALVIMVAFVGILSALMTLFIARRREFSILRAIGFVPSQIAMLIIGQALLIGLLAGLLAIPLGMLLSEILIHIINQRSFGWTLTNAFPMSILLQALWLSCIAAVLASVYPTFYSTRSSVRSGLLLT